MLDEEPHHTALAKDTAHCQHPSAYVSPNYCFYQLLLRSGCDTGGFWTSGQADELVQPQHSLQVLGGYKDQTQKGKGAAFPSLCCRRQSWALRGSWQLSAPLGGAQPAPLCPPALTSCPSLPAPGGLETAGQQGREQLEGRDRGFPSLGARCCIGGWDQALMEGIRGDGSERGQIGCSRRCGVTQAPALPGGVGPCLLARRCRLARRVCNRSCPPLSKAAAFPKPPPSANGALLPTPALRGVPGSQGAGSPPPCN